MEKINVAELLKDCPSGMELNCTMCDKFVLVGVDNSLMFPIKVSCKDGCLFALTKYGQCCDSDYAKCVIFPKGKTTWEGFKRPFKDGDILTTNIGSIFIFSHLESDWNDDRKICKAYVGIQDTMPISLFHTEQLDIFGPYESMCKLATEEEKEKLFQVIKDNGYKWNPETKTLDKLIQPEFKVGDRIKRKGDTRLTTIKDVRDNYYIITIKDIFDNAYITDKLLFSNQNEYEIVPNKFDITTLKPFDKVLVRGDVGQKWIPDFFGFMDKDKGYPYVCVRYYVIQCIPYEGNEHLLGKTVDCDEYFKTWK